MRGWILDGLVVSVAVLNALRLIDDLLIYNTIAQLGVSSVRERRIASPAITGRKARLLREYENTFIVPPTVRIQEFWILDSG
jgi:hypothetical protein